MAISSRQSTLSQTTRRQMGAEHVHLFNIVLWQIAVVHKSQSIFKTAQNYTFIISLYFLGHCFPWNRVMTGGCRKSRPMWLVLNIPEMILDVLWEPGWTRAVWQEQNWLFTFLYMLFVFFINAHYSKVMNNNFIPSNFLNVLFNANIRMTLRRLCHVEP